MRKSFQGGPGTVLFPPRSAELAETLDRLQRRLWPRRSQVELLLDLGERKGWNESDRLAQLRAAASWLAQEEVVGAVAPSRPQPGVEWASLKEVLAPLAPDRLEGRAAGTSSLLTFLAPAVGAHPKTLANSLREGIRTSRSDHRWLMLLGRVLSDPATVDALASSWCWSRRPAWSAAGGA